MATQRTINHGNGHIDTERLFTDADGNQVWAVIQCNQESDMTQYPTTGYAESASTTDARAFKIAMASKGYGKNHNTEMEVDRIHDLLVSMDYYDAHPVDAAQAIEQVIDAQLGVQEPPQDYRIFNRRQADGTFRPLSEFFDGVKKNDAKLSVSLFAELAEQHNRRASATAKVNPADCKHEREHPQHNGWACNACHRVREAEGDFEKRQVSRLNYKGNGYVNYRMR